MKLFLLTLLSAAACAVDIRATLNHPREEDTVVDSDPRFDSPLRRWARRHPDDAEHSERNMASVVVHLSDVASRPTSLLSHGFERVSLSASLLPIFEAIGREGLNGSRVGPSFGGSGGGTSPESLEEELAQRLRGWEAFALKDASAFNLACSGFVIRRGGPLGVALEGAGFDGVAQRVHIDQDLEGEPLRRLGLVWALRWVPFLHLINVWTPLSTPRLRPLALMDLSTLDAERDVLRYTYTANSTRDAGGPGGSSFTSDRLMTLHRSEHRWFWDSGVEFGHAVTFLTGRTAHASVSLEAEERWLASVRRALLAAHLPGDGALLGEPILPTAECARLEEDRRSMEAALRAAGRESPPATAALLRDVTEVLTAACGPPPLSKNAAADLVGTALASLARSSLEIRCATLVLDTSALAGIAAFVALIFTATGYYTARMAQMLAVLFGRRRRLRHRGKREKAE